MENNYFSNIPINNKMFEDKELIYSQNTNKPCILPSIGSITDDPLFFEPELKPLISNKHNFKNSFNNEFKISKSNWEPDFSERFDVVSDSINLALYTLGMSKAEYNSCDILSLKSQRRIDCSCEQIWALNILINYKNSTNSNLPNISPIKHNLNDSNPFENEMRNKLYSSEDFSIYDR